MFHTNVVEKSKHILRSITKIGPIYEIMWKKYCTAGQATDDNMAHAHCMLDTYGYKHTLRIYNTYRFSTATKVVRTRLNVTLHVHCLTCLYSFEANSGFWHYPKLEC